MIIKTSNDNIFNTKAKHIAFAINTEGLNDSGFAGKISQNWRDLENCGKNRIGTVISKNINGKMFHALVCYSLNGGWGDNQAQNIRECFDNIPSNGEPIASISIGTGFIGKKYDVSLAQIICGMHDSNQKIILYDGFTLDYLMSLYDKEKIERIERKLV